MIKKIILSSVAILITGFSIFSVNRFRKKK